MRTVWVLVAKDLKRRLRDPAALLLNLAIPLAIAGTMVLAFGGSGSGGRVPPLRLVLVDLDKTPFSRIVSGTSQNPEMAERLVVRRADGREEGLGLLRREELAAMLVIPKGFGDGFLGGRQVALELVKNPSQSIMPIAAQQGVEVLALYLSGAARLLGEDTARLQRLFEGEGWGDAAGIAGMITTAHARTQAARELLFPPIIEVAAKKREDGGFNWMGWMYPGMVVMGLLFVAVMQMRDLLHEGRAGTLRRLLVAPTTPAQVLLSKMLSVAVVTAIALALLLAMGALAFGIDWGRPGPLLVVSALVVFAATGFAALVYSLVRTERQGDAVSGIAVMLMSLLGGSFVPPQVLPDWLKQIAPFTVNHWAQESLRALTAGEAWTGVGSHLAALAALGAVFTALGMTLLARRHVRGVL